MSDTTDTTTGQYTEALLAHLAECSQCIAARRTPGMPKCPTGRDLIKKTLDERHGGPTA